MKTLLFYVQHLLGIGYVFRTTRVARALESAGVRVHLAWGGSVPRSLDRRSLKVTFLEQVRSDGAGFERLVTPDGAAVTEAVRARRAPWSPAWPARACSARFSVAMAMAMATISLARCLRAAWLGALLAAGGAAQAGSVQLEDMTWVELRERVAAGATTVLLPIGGTEQNGPHMSLGKHNARVKVLATRIAERLGNALVAPVLAYVPEGAIEPPTAHMRYPGTLSIPASAFEVTLEGAARSLAKHGLREIVLLGDHGGYRASLERVAAKLNREWRGPATARLHALPEYYRAGTTDFAAALAAQGFRADEIGGHAGLADTSLTLALVPAAVRSDLPGSPASGPRRDGVVGDPRRASAELGRAGAEHIVVVSVAAIRSATAKPK